jgi:apolipoprotein N-acyltransferase
MNSSFIRLLAYLPVTISQPSRSLTDACLCYTRKVRRIRLNAWIFACLSGVLQVLIFPNFSIYLLSWVALAPLIYAILKCREQDVTMVLADGGQFLAPATAWQGFLLGYVSGVIWYLGSCYWVYHVMHVYGGINPATSAILLVMFALYLGLYHGLFGLLLALIAARRNGFSLRALVFTPFVWVAVEMARTYITGFPWDLLGTTQIDNIPLSRIATVTGVYGISFEIALVNTAVAAAFLVPYAKRKLLLTAALVSAIILHAGKLLKPGALPTEHGATLVQANIPILDTEWSPEYFAQTLDSLRALSVRPQFEKSDSPGLIIWPESRVARTLLDDRPAPAHDLGGHRPRNPLLHHRGLHWYYAYRRSQPPSGDLQLGCSDCSEWSMDRPLRQDSPGSVR